MHCLLIGRRSLPFNPGWVDQARNVSRHAGNDLPFVALQPSVVPFGWKMIPGRPRRVRAKTSYNDRSFRFLGLDRVGPGAVYSRVSMVSPFGFTMGAACNPSNAALDRGMERFLFSRVFQSHHRLLSSSSSDPEEEPRGWGVDFFLP